MHDSDKTLGERTLAFYLESALRGFGRPVLIEKFPDRQSNSTYKFALPSGAIVMRQKPPSALMGRVRAMDREFKVITALRGTGVPVPQPFVSCDDENVIGSPFLAILYVNGRVFWAPAFPTPRPAERASIYESINVILAAIGRIGTTDLDLADFGKPDDYFEQQIQLWSREHLDSATENIAEIEELIEWLPAHLPSSENRTSSVHGDFRLDNLVCYPIEPRAVAVLDWEWSTVGDPDADFAYLCMQWRLPSGNDWRGLDGSDRVVLLKAVRRTAQLSQSTMENRIIWRSKRACLPQPDQHNPSTSRIN